jgi:hypothetical protein
MPMTRLPASSVNGMTPTDPAIVKLCEYAIETGILPKMNYGSTPR